MFIKIMKKSEAGLKLAYEESNIFLKQKRSIATTPDEWLPIWDSIDKMRKKEQAPVDTMGCGVAIKKIPKEQ